MSVLDFCHMTVGNATCMLNVVGPMLGSIAPGGRGWLGFSGLV